MNLNMFPLLDTRDNKAFALELAILAAMASNHKRDTPTKLLFQTAGYNIGLFDDGKNKEVAHYAIGNIGFLGKLLEKEGPPNAKQEMLKWLDKFAETKKELEQQHLLLADKNTKEMLDKVEELPKKIPKSIAEAHEMVEQGINPFEPFLSNRTTISDKDFIQPFSTYISEKAFELLSKHDNTFAVEVYERDKGGFLFRALEPQGGDYNISDYKMMPASHYETEPDGGILFKNDDNEYYINESTYIGYEYINSTYKPAVSLYLHFESAKQQEDATTRLDWLKTRFTLLQQKLADEEDLFNCQEEMWKEDHVARQKALKYATYNGKSENSSIEENRAQILINSAVLSCIFHLEQINNLNTFMKKIIIFEMMRVACADDLASETALVMMKTISEIFRLPESFVDELLLAFSNNDRDEVIELIEE